MIRLILALLFFAVAVPASAANIYEIKNVSVTVSGINSAKSRDKAMLEAQKKAFDELQKKLITSGYITAAKTLTEPQVQGTVDAIDIVSEKMGAKDYKGTYNVTFNPAEVSRILAIGEITQIAESEKYLIVPIVVEKGALKIWKNDWLQNWQAEKHADIIFPLGDLQDVQSMKPEDIREKRYDGIFRMQKRYAATAIVLVKAEYLEDKNVLAVELQKLKDQERTTVSYEYPGGTGITPLDLFEAAASDIIYRLQNNKLADNSLAADPHTPPKPKLPGPYSPNAPGSGFIGEKKYPPSLAPLSAVTTPPAAPSVIIGSAKTDITVIAPDLIVWNRIRNKLTTAPGVKDLKIRSLLGGKADITISHDGDMQALTASLAAKGLILSEQGQTWQLQEKP